MVEASGSLSARVAICGARGSYPAIGGEYEKYGGHTACIAAFLPSGITVFDGGTGLIRLNEMLAGSADGAPRDAAVVAAAGAAVPPIRIFLSHLHYDHILGLPFFHPIYQPGRDITIYVAENMIQPLQAFWNKPYFPVAATQAPAVVKIVGLPDQVQMDLGQGFTLQAKRMYHTAHTDGVYMFRLGGPQRDLAYVTDIELNNDGIFAQVADFVRSCNTLLCDAQYLPGADYEKHRGWGHNSVEMASRLAAQAATGLLCLIHHEPGRSDAALDALSANMAANQPPTVVAAVGNEFSI